MDYETPDPRHQIVSWTFRYRKGGEGPDSRRGGREITITSEGSRHWRKATVKDVGRIVFLRDAPEFGEFDDVGEVPDEEFPDAVIKTAEICTQSGELETPWARDNGTFENVLVVPDEVLDGVNFESAPPEASLPGLSVPRSPSAPRGRWSPAPDRTSLDEAPVPEIAGRHVHVRQDLLPRGLLSRRWVVWR